MEVKTNVIKRNGKEVSFDISKIENAIRKANQNVERIHQMNDYQIRAVADNIAQQVGESTHAVNGRDRHYGNARLRGCAEVCALPLQTGADP